MSYTAYHPSPEPAYSEQPRLARLARSELTRWFCACVGFATPFTVVAAGNFPVAEWLLFAAAAGTLVLRAVHGRWPEGAIQTRWFGVLMLCQVVALAGYIVSDLYRGSAPQDYLRGWARMVFLGVDLLALASVLGTNWRRWLALKVGLAFGFAAQAVIFGPLFGDWWKFGFALPVTLLALVLAARGNVMVATAIAAGLGLLHFFLGYRSVGGECLVVATLLQVPRVNPRWRLPVVGAAFGVALLVTGLVAVISADADSVTQRGSNAERYSMVSVAAESFLESPLVGQGSWFSATHLVRRIEARRMQIEEGFSGYDEESASRLAVHSQILVALAEGGFFGGLFFLVYGGLLVWALSYALTSERPQQALVLFCLMDALWNVLMSPFSGPARVHIAAAAVLALLLWLESRGRLAWRPGSRGPRHSASPYPYPRA